jgi:hypothetical protein
MRLWLKDSERLPDPEPAVTDDRKAIVVGLGGWIVALSVVVVFGVLSADHPTWALVWTCVVGIVLGIIGLGYTHHRRRRNPGR